MSLKNNGTGEKQSPDFDCRVLGNAEDKILKMVQERRVEGEKWERQWHEYIDAINRIGLRANSRQNDKAHKLIIELKALVTDIKIENHVEWIKDNVRD